MSEKQVRFANTMLGEEKIGALPVTETAQYVRQSKCNVISLIGVLEHLVNFKEILEAVKSNHAIQYMYFSVPLFSVTCIFEAVFQKGYNRHLGAGHTHLFTLDSIKYMNERYGFQEIASWRFGTDMMDLYRFLTVALKQKNQDLKKILDEFFLPCVNEMQVVLDQNGFCSEIHMLVKNKNEK